MKRILSLALAMLLAASAFAVPAAADENPAQSAGAGSEIAVDGRVYTFDEDTGYAFSSGAAFESTETARTYGSFQIRGLDGTLTKTGAGDDLPSFEMGSGSIEIGYSYADELLLASDDEIHLDSDKGRRVDGMELGRSVEKGTLILQRSIDRKNWCNITVLTNAFENTPRQTEPMYVTTDVELINGTYYRLIAAYKTAIRGDTKKIAGLISKNTYTYQWHAEVYEFYAVLKNERIEPLEPAAKRFSLGETILVSDRENYSGEKPIESGDLHYGWDLGQFFVSGYTDKVTESDGSIVFLKNVGDVVTLWFNLKQNIDALNGNKDLVIADEETGSDQYFRTPTTRFGRGMLIVRYTDHENVRHDPVMYSDYLAANATLGANTRAQLFEEGDYEVALDYKVRKDGPFFLDSAENFRIFFKFSVRNANCMVYPFDTKTGSELTNSSMTENGFYLDLARSRYLKIFIKKDVWIQGADGLVEDTRFNTPVKDGARFTEEGIYTITVKNEYTGLETTKRIYVGNDPIMKAYVTSDYSIREIVNLVEAGAEIDEQGAIIMKEASDPGGKASEPSSKPDVEESETGNTHDESGDIAGTEPADPKTEEETGGGHGGLFIGIAAAAAAAGAGGLLWKKRRGREEH